MNTHNLITVERSELRYKGIAIPGVDAIYTTDSYKSVEGLNCFSVEKYLAA